MPYTTGPPATAPYSTTPQFCHPSTRARIIEYSRYAKLVYNVHRALNRRERWRKPSNRAVDCAILVDRVDSVFSKNAGDLSSPYSHPIPAG